MEATASFNLAQESGLYVTSGLSIAMGMRRLEEGGTFRKSATFEIKSIVLCFQQP